MNLLAAETVDSEAIQQVASNGGGIPLIAIVLVILALLVVLVILASILSSKKKAETRPVSQQDQKKQEKIKQEKEMKKQKHEEKQFMEKPSGLPEDNMIGKKAKRVKEPVVKKPVVVKEQVEPAEPVAEEPVVEEPVKEPIEEPVEPVVDESRAEFDAINAIVIDGVCSARSYEPGDKITFKFNYGLATELNVAVLPELLSLTDKIANVRAEAYNGATIMVHADCLAPFAVKTLQAKPIVDKASVLSGKPKVTLKIYLEQVVR
ncbi:MAG: hypothetical protein ACLR6B_03400 [Blautia sp.]